MTKRMVARLPGNVTVTVNRITTDADWDESKVKRDEGGKFSAKEAAAKVEQHEAAQSFHEQQARKLKGFRAAAHAKVAIEHALSARHFKQALGAHADEAPTRAQDLFGKAKKHEQQAHQMRTEHGIDAPAPEAAALAAPAPAAAIAAEKAKQGAPAAPPANPHPASTPAHHLRPDPAGYKDPALGRYVGKRLDALDAAAKAPNAAEALAAVDINKYHPRLHAYRAALLSAMGSGAPGAASPAAAPAPAPAAPKPAPAAAPAPAARWAKRPGGSAFDPSGHDLHIGEHSFEVHRNQGPSGGGVLGNHYYVSQPASYRPGWAGDPGVLVQGATRAELEEKLRRVIAGGRADWAKKVK